jgi:hypothetical protein
LNQPPSGLRSGWDSAVKAKSIAPAHKTNAEDDDSLVRYGGMVGDDEDDEMERSVVINNGVVKRSPTNYVRTLNFYSMHATSS